jgi:Peptidase A4 family
MSGDTRPGGPETAADAGMRQADNRPPGFDPVAASDAELARYGYPRRPDQATQPLAYQRWMSVVSRPTTMTAAVFGPPSPVPPGPPGGLINPGGFGNDPGVQLESLDWAGRAATVTYSQYPIQTIYGTWTVPRIVQPPGFQSYGCSSWIGLDGAGNDPKLSEAGAQQIQAGTTVAVADGSPSCEAWFYWWPSVYQQSIANFDFAAGDVISCSIDVTGRDGEGFINEVCGTWWNLTTRLSVNSPQSRPATWSPDYPDPTPAPGFVANWLLEAPPLGAVLAQFASVYYDNCWAFTDGPEVGLDSGQGSLISMVDSIEGHAMAVPGALDPAVTGTSFGVGYVASY